MKYFVFDDPGLDKFCVELDLLFGACIVPSSDMVRSIWELLLPIVDMWGLALSLLQEYFYICYLHFPILATKIEYNLNIFLLFHLLFL